MNEKTLAHWSQLFGIPVHTGNNSIGTYTYVVVDHSTAARKELWDLTDYRVSSVCGLTIYLVPVAASR